jgi:Fic family protein
MRRLRQYIHQRESWPEFCWDEQKLSPLLAEVRHNQGRLLGRQQWLDFDLRLEATLVALTSEVVSTSAIEGAMLNA